MPMLRCKGLTGCKSRIFICALNAVNVTRVFPRVFLVGTLTEHSRMMKFYSWLSKPVQSCEPIFFYGNRYLKRQIQAKKVSYSKTKRGWLLFLLSNILNQRFTNMMRQCNFSSPSNIAFELAKSLDIPQARDWCSFCHWKYPALPEEWWSQLKLPEHTRQVQVLHKFAFITDAHQE